MAEKRRGVKRIAEDIPRTAMPPGEMPASKLTLFKEILSDMTETSRLD
jgi:hypothetical protein